MIKIKVGQDETLEAMKLRGALFAALLSSANALRSHCADSNGEFVGLVGDHHYAVESAPNGDAWTSTQDDGTSNV